MSDDFRDRWKAVNRSSEKKSDDLFSAWADQKKMQEEDKKLEQELIEAKKKARELKKTLYKHKFGESKSKLRENSESYATRAKGIFEKLKSIVLKNRKLSVVGLSVIVVMFVGLSIINKEDNSTGILGESDSNLTITEDLPREKPNFKLLFPSGTKAEDYDVVRISPPEADASYTYLDRFTEGGQIFRVTQQEIPEDFDLAKVATDFQATSIIQIDDNVIYHGYSEQGGIQSILFEKDKNLISIRSPQKFSDDLWASYILSLE